MMMASTHVMEVCDTSYLWLSAYSSGRSFLTIECSGRAERILYCQRQNELSWPIKPHQLSAGQFEIPLGSLVSTGSAWRESLQAICCMVHALVEHFLPSSLLICCQLTISHHFVQYDYRLHRYLQPGGSAVFRSTLATDLTFSF